MAFCTVLQLLGHGWNLSHDEPCQQVNKGAPLLLSRLQISAESPPEERCRTLRQEGEGYGLHFHCAPTLPIQCPEGSEAMIAKLCPPNSRPMISTVGNRLERPLLQLPIRTMTVWWRNVSRERQQCMCIIHPRKLRTPVCLLQCFLVIGGKHKIDEMAQVWQGTMETRITECISTSCTFGESGTTTLGKDRSRPRASMTRPNHDWAIGNTKVKTFHIMSCSRKETTTLWSGKHIPVHVHVSQRPPLATQMLCTLFYSATCQTRFMTQDGVWRHLPRNQMNQFPIVPPFQTCGQSEWDGPC